MKKYSFIFILLMCFVFMLSGCANKGISNDTIVVNSHSEYVQTFDDLNLGILYDFNLTLHNADKKWVRIWVEVYQEGDKVQSPIGELSYGMSPNKVEEGHLGFGLINPNSDYTMAFLYGPNVKLAPQKIEMLPIGSTISTWDYAIGEDKVNLIPNETYLLAVYRQASDSLLNSYNLQDVEEVQKMIKDDDYVLLLKLKIEDDDSSKLK